MRYVTCECGHQNPYGTKICLKCGRPLTEEAKNQKVLDMRYDGSAIRSKTYNKSIIDKIWNFFSSVKVGVSLIVITLVVASIGTIFPQKSFIAVSESEVADYYEKNYGSLGKLYYNLGLSEVYSAWWFQIIVGLLAISIIVASFDRGLPLYKSLKNQRVKRHESFMKRQRIIAEGAITQGDSSNTLSAVEEKLKALRYKVRREDNSILAERGRFARWGPYINHLGLIIFIFGVMLRLVPGFYINESMWIREGEVRAIPGMDGYFLENERFILETHDNEMTDAQIEQGVNTIAKNFQTDVKLYKQTGEVLPGKMDNLELVKEYSIRVNYPLQHEGYNLYQIDFRLNELKTMTFSLVEKATGKSLGDITIDLMNPQKEYVIDDKTKVVLKDYKPDFSGFDDNGEPQTASSQPNNPAFIFVMYTPETPDGEISFVGIQTTVEPNGDNKYQMKFTNVETRNLSGITITKDRSIPILIVGGIIFLLGLVIGSYFNHRRIWIEQLQDGTIRLAAHVNKNWHSIKKDLNVLTEQVHLPPYIDQLEKVEKKENKDGDNTK